MLLSKDELSTCELALVRVGSLFLRKNWQLPPHFHGALSFSLIKVNKKCNFERLQ